jgi:hypothetical protein
MYRKMSIWAFPSLFSGGSGGFAGQEKEDADFRVRKIASVQGSGEARPSDQPTVGQADLQAVGSGAAVL